MLPRLLEFIGGDILAAHNAGFDAKFLLAESARQGLSPRHGGLICSLKLARRLLPGRSTYKLGELARSLDIRFSGNAHRAEADAEVTVHLLNHLGHGLCRTYACSIIATSLLEAITRQTAARVPDFLTRCFHVSTCAGGEIE